MAERSLNGGKNGEEVWVVERRTGLLVGEVVDYQGDLRLVTAEKAPRYTRWR